MNTHSGSISAVGNARESTPVSRSTSVSYDAIVGLRLLPGRILVEEPRVFYDMARTTQGIHLPDSARRAIGCLTRIVRVSSDIASAYAEAGVVEGATVLVPEYAGMALHGFDGPLAIGDTRLWVIGAGDIIAVVVLESTTGEASA